MVLISFKDEFYQIPEELYPEVVEDLVNNDAELIYMDNSSGLFYFKENDKKVPLLSAADIEEMIEED